MIVTSYDEICPINEKLLFSLYDAAKRGLPVPVSDVPPERRSSVALFCYRRSHLEKAALAVAAICDEEDLVEAGGGSVARSSSNLRRLRRLLSSLNNFKALTISLGASQNAKC
jgi:hypothetical protein